MSWIIHCPLATKLALCWVEGFQRVSTSVLELLSPVVGAVLALQAEVDVGADAAVVQRLDRTDVVAHAQEDLRW